MTTPVTLRDLITALNDKPWALDQPMACSDGGPEAWIVQAIVLVDGPEGPMILLMPTADIATESMAQMNLAYAKKHGADS